MECSSVNTNRTEENSLHELAIGNDDDEVE